TARLVDPVSGQVFVEYTCGASDTFTVGLGELDGQYDFGLPQSTACTLTEYRLGPWPANEALFANATGPMTSPMLEQATAALYALPSPEPLAALVDGGLTEAVEVGQDRQDNVFYAFTQLE